MQVIPFTSDPWQSFSCTLDGVEYGFRASYNDRNGVWYFDISLKATEAVLVAGVPILLGCDLLAPFGLGIGTMFAVDLAASAAPAMVTLTPTQASIAGVAAQSSQPALQMVDAGPEDLGTRVIVVFVAPGETVRGAS